MRAWLCNMWTSRGSVASSLAGTKTNARKEIEETKLIVFLGTLELTAAAAAVAAFLLHKHPPDTHPSSSG